MPNWCEIYSLFYSSFFFRAITLYNVRCFFLISHLIRPRNSLVFIFLCYLKNLEAHDQCQWFHLWYYCRVNMCSTPKQKNCIKILSEKKTVRNFHLYFPVLLDYCNWIRMRNGCAIILLKSFSYLNCDKGCNEPNI